MGKRKDAYEYAADDNEQEALIKIGKQLLALPKSKDAVFKLLKNAQAALEQAPQGSEGTKLAIGDLSKALGRRELVHHKDKEVRLYTASCLCLILKIHAPETPYSDAELKEIFSLFNSVYAELEDHTGAHFPLCLSIFETVSQVKCSVLMLDLDADELVCDLFSTVFAAINDENQSMLESSALELLGSLLEESDDVSQQLLDAILVNLLPAKQQENMAACKLAQHLLQRTESHMQPYLQTFMTHALLGMRTDSELKDDCHGLIFQLYQAVPQVLLPVLPHLNLELQVDADDKRLAAAELLGKLFSQPGSRDILQDYPDLFQDLLKRLHDLKVDVRLKVLTFCKGLLDNCGDGNMRRHIMQGVLDRLMDVDDKVRSAAAGTFCAIAADYPSMAGTGLEALVSRLRDKKLAVRKEVASQVVGLIRAWCMRCQQNLPGTSKQQVISLALVLCNLATRDADLGSFVMDHLFRSGIFPAKLPIATQVEWWTLLWHKAGDTGHESIAKLLRGKYGLQRQVRILIQLRDATKERRQAGGATSSLAASGTGSGMQPSTSRATAVADPEKGLQTEMHMLAKSLHDINKSEEGLQKLWEMKDNHIFRGLGTLAAYGTSLEEATAAGKDVMQRVGAKGPAAEVARTLVNRMMPSLLSPELLQAAMEHAAESQEAQMLVMDVAAIAPQLFAQSLDPLVSMLEQDDPVLSSCAAKILGKAGKYIAAANQGKQGSGKDWEDLVGKVEDTLLEMCSGSSPSSAKAAVYALVTLVGTEEAAAALKPVCESLMDSMKRPSTLNNHPKLVTAIKAMSTVGRTLPKLFAENAEEFTEFILEQLLSEDLSRGKPLRPATKGTGEEWGRPSPGIDVKAAALKALAQSLVPDNRKAPAPSKEVADAVQVVLSKLVGLVNPDEESPEFEGIGLVGAVDGGWIRCAAASSMLRLARGHDNSIGSDLYLELALSMQDPYPEARRLLVSKVFKAAEYSGSPQRAAKYAALLGLLAVDPVASNQAASFRALREYVASRRRALQASAQAAAAAGAGGNLIQEMPEFVLPYLIFILAHHPDYPSAEELEEWDGMDDEERAEAEEAGQGHPLAPFQNMLQFVLEPLVFPPAAPTNAAEIAQAIPATLKLLRTLKYCDDAAPEEQRTENAHQLCDVAMALVKSMVDRATKGKSVEPGRFPGSVLLPRMCFRAKDIRGEGKKPEGSDLPPHFVPLLTDELFSQRFANMMLPGPAKRARSRGNPRGGGRHSQQEAAAASEDEDGEQGPAEEEVATQHSSDEGSDAEDDVPGSSNLPKKGVKRKAPSNHDAQLEQQAKRSSKPVRQKKLPGRPRQGAAAGREEGAVAPKRKKTSPGSGQKKGKTAEPKAQSPATRQQPRRGAKAAAASKLRADTSDEEVDVPAGRPGARSPTEAAAADDPMSQSDFENASMGGSPGLGPSGQQRRGELRASTEDEESSQDMDDEQGLQQQQAVRRRAGAAKPAAGNGGRAVGKGQARPAAALKPKSKNIRA